MKTVKKIKKVRRVKRNPNSLDSKSETKNYDKYPNAIMFSDPEVKAMRLINAVPDLMQAISQDQYDRLYLKIIEALETEFTRGAELAYQAGVNDGYVAGHTAGSTAALEYCNKNFQALAQNEVRGQYFDFDTKIRVATNRTEKGN